MTAPRNRDKMIDVPEQRSGATRLEFRENKSTGEVTIRGYAATYEPYDCYGGPDSGGWVEQLRHDAFDRTLQAKPDVMLLVNHTGAPLARTKSGTMTLSRDRRGLLVEARLDSSDPDVQALLPKMRRGDMDEMSFAFRVKDQEWSEDYSHRMIHEVSLQKGDVSVVNYGMNPNTRVAVTEGAVALAELSHAQLAELRRLDSGLIERAISNLSRATKRSKDSEGKPMGKDEEDDEKKSDNPFAKDDEDDDEKKSDNPFASDDEDPDDEEGKAKRENPFADDEDDEEEPDGDDKKSAERALRATLEKLSKCRDKDARVLAARATGQLNVLRGSKSGSSPVERMLSEMRKEVGKPGSLTVSESLELLKQLS